VPCPLIQSDWLQVDWSVFGDRIPADHNYRLYSALCTQLPGLKDLDWQLGTIAGIPDVAGWIKLGRESRMFLRCHFADLHLVLSLAEQVLQIGQSFVQLRDPVVRQLREVKSLRSRLVTIKRADMTAPDPVHFALSLGQQLGKLGIHSLPTIGRRGCLRVQGSDIVGYGITFGSLSKQESLILQYQGLGGKRRMGCGVFYAG